MKEVRRHIGVIIWSVVMIAVAVYGFIVGEDFCVLASLVGLLLGIVVILNGEIKQLKETIKSK